MSSKVKTGTDDLLADLTDGVLTLTMNRPEARNAMSDAMTSALAQQLADAELNSDVKVIVLTGAGKGFCAGGDVKGMAASGDGTVGDNTIDGAIHRQRLNQRGTAGALYSIPKPTIAALPGAAAGAGLSLALACDMRIMASSAMMTTAFAKVGFSGDYGGTFFMSQLIGTAKARELYFLSDRVKPPTTSIVAKPKTIKMPLRHLLRNAIQYLWVARAQSFRTEFRAEGACS
jgi:2-(1,2-epoxy-1,2-dihydrophenyl)acetyl-CoA isomerase